MIADRRLLHSLALLSISVALGCAAWICADEVRRPQPMAVMNVVWPVTALYSGPLGLCAYYGFGRAQAESDDTEASSFASVAKATTHCGAGCTLGDLAAETALAAWPAITVLLGTGTLWSDPIFSGWILDFALAYVLGIAFQYFSIKPMHPELPVSRALGRALKADTLSLAAWQLGMYAVMAAAHFWLFPMVLHSPLRAGGAVFWWVMQFAMMAGFATAYPVNRWLVAAGIKEAM